MSRNCYNCMQPVEDYSGVCPHCGQAPFEVNPVHQLKTGTFLKDRYLIGKSLGQGGFGITYIGLDTMLDVRVAVKEYYPNGISNRNHEASDHVTMTSTGADVYERGKLRFLQEAKTLARFYEEPGIVSVHDFFEDNNTAYIVMEYLDGITLKRFVEAQGKIPANALFRAMRPIMRSLEKVHAQDVIHRDISPDNIILLRDGTLKLLDFGSAREVGGDKSLSVMLKPGYAPEEQYRSKGKQGPWTDIYALCATMYYCLTEVKPEESVERMVEDTLRRPSELGADITQAQESVILRGMAVHAKDRYQSMAELADALKDSPARVVVLDPPEPTPPTAPTDPPKPRRRRKKNLILPIAGILTVALLIFAGMKVFGIHESNPVISESVSTPVVTEKPSPTPPPTPVPTPQPPTAEELKYIEAENLLASGDKAHAAMAFYKLGDYKDSRKRSFALWDQIAERRTVAYAGHWVGLKSDGTVISDAVNSWAQDIHKWTDIAAVAAGLYITVGLKTDGTVVAVMDESYSSECDVSGWTDIVAIRASLNVVAGLRADGTVLITGDEYLSSCVSDWTDIVALELYTTKAIYGVRADGTVVSNEMMPWTSWNQNTYVPGEISDWTNIVSVSTGGAHTVGLKSDGTVVAIGYKHELQCDVSAWMDIVMIATGQTHTVGLRKNGTVITTLDPQVPAENFGQRNVSWWTDIVDIFAGTAYTIGLKADGSLVSVGKIGNPPNWTDIAIPKGATTHVSGGTVY